MKMLPRLRRCGEGGREKIERERDPRLREYFDQKLKSTFVEFDDDSWYSSEGIFAFTFSYRVRRM